MAVEDVEVYEGDEYVCDTCCAFGTHPVRITYVKLPPKPKPKSPPKPVSPVEKKEVSKKGVGKLNLEAFATKDKQKRGVGKLNLSKFGGGAEKSPKQVGKLRIPGHSPNGGGKSPNVGSISSKKLAAFMGGD